jgi:TPR repeat protein
VVKDMGEAVRWYSLAAERGDRFAARDLAKMYYQGDGVAKDFKQFLAWTAKAAELGHPEAQANLGLMLVQGQELPKDVATGVRLVQAAANQNDGYAWSLIGSFHQDGLLPQSPAMAAEAYRRAVSLGYTEARAFLTPALRRVALLDPTEAAAQKDRQAAEAGDATAALRMADRCADGIGIARNLPDALVWYEKSAAQGNPVAMGMAGLLLITGQAGSKDQARGIDLTRRASQAGDPGALLTMGDLYGSGLMGVADANAQAARWYEKAAAAGNAEAETRLKALR